MNPRLSPLRLILRYARLPDLLAGALLYALGAGLTVFLGHPLDWRIYFLGQTCITTLQLSAYFLKSAFDLPPVNQPKSLTQDEVLWQRSTILNRNAVLLAAATSLTIGAVFTVILFSNGAIQSGAFIFLGMGILLALAYALPPLRLAYSGYGELIQALLVANITPALAFLLQTGTLHRLLISLTLPLTVLYTALQLALSLRTYARDERFEDRTAMVRLGWSHGMNLHNLLILFAYLFLGFSTLLDLPWVLLRAGLLSLPVGLFQIWQIQRIAGGAKPNWPLLAGTAAATFALTAYFITFALWTS